MNAQTDALKDAKQAVADAQQALDDAVTKDEENSTTGTKGQVTKCKNALESAQASLDAIETAVGNQETQKDNQEVVLQSEKDAKKKPENELSALAKSQNAEEQKPKSVERVEALRRNLFGMATHQFTSYDANVPHGTKKEHILNPDFWVNVARGVSIGDEIRVVPDDFSFYAKLLVTKAIGVSIDIKLIEFVELDPIVGEKVDSGPYYVEEKGRLKYCVIKTATGTIERSNFSTAVEAETHLRDLQKALNM